MSVRGKQAIIRLAKSIIDSNSAERGRKRLKGPLFERGRATKKLTDLVFIVRMAGAGREWSRSDVDTVVHELRQQASDTRLAADLRCRAVINLAVLEGFIPASELDDSQVAKYIKSLVEPKPAAQPTTQTPTPSAVDVEALRRQFDAL